MKALHTQHIRHGTYKKDQIKRACEHIQQLKTSDKMGYTITITQFDMSKSAAQRGYYFGVVIPEMMRWQGCSDKAADKMLKKELLAPEVTKILGKNIETWPSIADMNLGEMAEYIDDCINFMGSWGIAVPSPPYKKPKEYR